MKIAILGTKGIPNNHGGFEQFAEYLSLGLSEKGHEVTVYTPHDHPFQGSHVKKVQIKRFYCPEKSVGAAAHFLYDFLCLRDAVKQPFDIIYEAGYQSSAYAIWYFRNKKTSAKIVTNMDGMEWKRSKWNAIVKKVTRFSEKLAVRYSHTLIADNVGIQNYFSSTYAYKQRITYLPYGAEIVDRFDEQILGEFSLTSKDYFLVIARMEPENNIEMMIQGYLNSGVDHPLVIVGGLNTKFAKQLLQAYGREKKICFAGAVYDKKKLDALRHFSRAYLHGHSVGGTNPSLLEAMACSCFILSHRNEFNGSVLNQNALYFESASELTNVILNMDVVQAEQIFSYKNNNLEEIRTKYNWNHVVDLHETFFTSLHENRHNNAK